MKRAKCLVCCCLLLSVLLILSGCIEPSTNDDTSSQTTSITSNLSSEEESTSSETFSEPSSEPLNSDTSSVVSTSSDTTVSANNTTSIIPPHEHTYYRPKDHWCYIGDGFWDGTGSRKEEDWGKIFPTCTKKGYTIYVCSICSHVKYDDYVEPTGHTLDKERIVYPKYGSGGYKLLRCSDCGYEEDSGIIYPARLGDLSGIGEGVIHTNSNCDFFVYDTGYGDIDIYDYRIYECYVPTIEVHEQEQYILLKYDLSDGTTHQQKINFPIVVDPEKTLPGIFYRAIIRSDGTFEGRYARWSWDGSGD